MTLHSLWPTKQNADCEPCGWVVVTIGKVIGPMPEEKAVNLAGMVEGHAFPLHAAWICGCTHKVATQ